jgi:hypothetical protein
MGAAMKRNKHSSSWIKPTTVIAIDGESVTEERHTSYCRNDPDVGWICNGHEHRYVLLVAASKDGFYRELDRRDTEITTERALDFIISLQADNVNKIIVGFSFQYDVAMILREWVLKQENPKEILTKINHSEPVLVCNDKYRITSIPRKMLIIEDANGLYDKVIVNDVFGYFQQSFVDTLSGWQIGLDELEAIREMKDARGDFTVARWNEIKDYCHKECLYLSELGHQLLDAIEEASLGSDGYYGPGALATWKLKEKKVTENYGVTGGMPTALYNNYVCYAYFGGRFDVAEAGYHPDTMQYDINSAYPYQITKLPCLTHSKWKKVNKYDPNVRIAIWEVKWKLPMTTRWPPFPYRTKTARVYYPYRGWGCYWQDEVREALALLPIYKKEGEASIEIVDGWILEENCNCQPGKFIEEMYEHRRQLKEAGKAAEKPMKLTYNSMYGKFAQTKGRRMGGWRRPEFQNFVYAGLITSGTRAMILHALRFMYDDALATATDSITTRPDANTSGMELDNYKLGAWDSEHTGKVWIIQPGLAWYPDKEKRAAKTRGHNPDDIDGKKLANLNFRNGKRGWERLVEAWITKYWIPPKDKAHFEYYTKKFIGIGMASQLKEYEHLYGTWVTRIMSVNFLPGRRVERPLYINQKDQEHRRAWRADVKNQKMQRESHRVLWFPTDIFPDDLQCNPYTTISFKYRNMIDLITAESEFIREQIVETDQPDFEDES